MLVFAAILGCLSPVLTVAATISSRSPFVSPLERREAADAAKRGFAREQSDHLAVLAAYEGWRDARADGRRGPRLHARLAIRGAGARRARAAGAGPLSTRIWPWRELHWRSPHGNSVLHASPPHRVAWQSGNRECRRCTPAVIGQATLNRKNLLGAGARSARTAPTISCRCARWRASPTCGASSSSCLRRRASWAAGAGAAAAAAAAVAARPAGATLTRTLVRAVRVRGSRHHRALQQGHAGRLLRSCSRGRPECSGPRQRGGPARGRCAC